MDYVEQIASALKFIAEYGLPNTFILSFSSFFLGLAVGVVLVFIQVFGGSVAAKVVGALTTVLRAIPPVLLLFIIFYGLPVTGMRLDGIVAAVLGLGLISSSYQSQILRSSIEAVASRQYEASLSIGLSRWQAFTSVILPQAIRLSIPGLMNEFTIVFKDTSLAYVIGVAEAFTRAELLARARMDYFTPLVAVALLYLAICLSISYSANLIYRKLRVLGYGQ